MKRFCLTILALVGIVLSSSAQDGKWRDISLNFSPDMVLGELTYTSGREINNQLFYGFGSGIIYHDQQIVEVNIDNTPTNVYIDWLCVPVFGDIKYRLFDSVVSPTLRLRAGVKGYLFSSEGLSLFATPEIGIDIFRRFSLSIAYNFDKYYSLSKNVGVDLWYTTIGLSFEFGN